MATYLYSVWLRDLSAEPADQDYKWVACIMIDARAEAEASSWGDFLARRRCAGKPTLEFLSSSAEHLDSAEADSIDSSGTVPRIDAGQDATDEQIGW